MESVRRGFLKGATEKSVRQNVKLFLSYCQAIVKICTPYCEQYLACFLRVLASHTCRVSDESKLLSPHRVRTRTSAIGTYIALPIVFAKIPRITGHRSPLVSTNGSPRTWYMVSNRMVVLMNTRFVTLDHTACPPTHRPTLYCTAQPFQGAELHNSFYSNG